MNNAHGVHALIASPFHQPGIGAAGKSGTASGTNCRTEGSSFFRDHGRNRDRARGVPGMCAGKQYLR